MNDARGGTQILQPYERGLEAPPVVTNREHDVLRHLAADLTTVEVADRLSLSAWTVRHHTKLMRIRSGTHTTHGLVAWAFRRGLVN